MSLPQTLDAYHDCIEIFDRALENKTRVAFASYGEAHQFQLRMCQCRALGRDETMRLYPRDDKRHGRSPYDVLVVRKPVKDDNNEWWVYIEKHGSNILAVEDAA